MLLDGKIKPFDALMTVHASLTIRPQLNAIGIIRELLVKDRLAILTTSPSALKIYDDESTIQPGRALRVKFLP